MPLCVSLSSLFGPPPAARPPLVPTAAPFHLPNFCPCPSQPWGAREKAGGDHAPLCCRAGWLSQQRPDSPEDGRLPCLSPPGPGPAQVPSLRVSSQRALPANTQDSLQRTVARLPLPASRELTCPRGSESVAAHPPSSATSLPPAPTSPPLPCSSAFPHSTYHLLACGGSGMILFMLQGDRGCVCECV